MKVLVLFAQYTDKLSYYDDWKDAFLAAPRFETNAVDICDRSAIHVLDKTIREYEFIVLLHSTNASTLAYLKPYTGVLTRRKGKLLIFIGNEVNLPGISMREKIDFIRETEPEYIGTQLPIEAGEWLFEECSASKVVALPHALNPDVFKPSISHEDRGVDIGVRSHKYLSYLGDNERNELFNFFLDYHFDLPMVLNISTESRFGREGWSAFLGNCRATIANEAGSYYLERDDKTVTAIREFVLERRKSKSIYIVGWDSSIIQTWRSLGIPMSVSRVIGKFLNVLGVKHELQITEEIAFEEVYDRFYKDYQRPMFYSKCISSRHFDAIGTKTCQIMLKGKFNRILKADEHYIALEHDFSNIKTVMAYYRDTTYREAMVNRTYEYVMDNHRYKHRINTISGLL